MSIIRPMKMLCLSPIVLALSTFMAVVYGYLYLLFTTLTGVFENTYHFSPGSVGLTYLGIGLGSILGLLLFGSVSDRIVKAKSAAGEMKPEYRLPPMIPGAWAIPIGCKFSYRYISVDLCMLNGLVFIYGWTAEKGVHWIAPILGTGLGESLVVHPQHQYSPLTSPTVGLGLLATFVRLFPPHPLLSPCSPSFHLHLTNLSLNIDAHINLPRRRLHPPRRLCSRRQHRPPLPRRRPPPPCGTENVREARSRVGKLSACVHRSEPVSDTVVLLSVRGTDTEESEVSGDVLRGCGLSRKSLSRMHVFALFQLGGGEVFRRWYTI